MIKMHWHPLDFFDGNSFFFLELGYNFWCISAVVIILYLGFGYYYKKKPKGNSTANPSNAIHDQSSTKENNG